MSNFIKALFVHKLMHQWVVLKISVTIYIEIYITTAPKYFGVTELV